MKLNSKAKLNLIILFVTLYMFAAFGWWTYSLVQYGNNEYNMQMEILQTDSIHAAGEAGHNMIHGRFAKPDGMRSIYNGDTIYTDTTALRAHVTEKFPNFDIHWVPNTTLAKSYKVFIKPSIVKKEYEKIRRKKAGWISEGLTMGLIMLMISIAMFLFLNRILNINQQQNNFLLAVTHELKTPVASAKLAIQTMAKEIDPEKENQIKLLKMADKNLARLGKMMDHVLMITRLDSHQKNQYEQIIELEEMLGHSLKELKDSMPETVKIETHFEPNLTIIGDRDQLEMAFSNLLTNAVKYSTTSQEHITVSTYIENGKVAMSVADQGMGIPDTEKSNIFRKFYRIGDENTRSSAGSGLGLYLVSKILRQHKAIISVEDNIPKGSKFKIVFRNKV